MPAASLGDDLVRLLYLVIDFVMRLVLIVINLAVQLLNAVAASLNHGVTPNSLVYIVLLLVFLWLFWKVLEIIFGGLGRHGATILVAIVLIFIVAALLS